MTPPTLTKREQRSRERSVRRGRAAGGPQDHAHYRCACGHAFAGKVTTHVACPRCGTEQDW
jgi:hypothetical protein